MGLGEMQGMHFVCKAGKLANRGVFDQFESDSSNKGTLKS